MTNLDDDENDVADLEADQDKDPKVQEHKNLKQKAAKSYFRVSLFKIKQTFSFNTF